MIIALSTIFNVKHDITFAVVSRQFSQNEAPHDGPRYALMGTVTDDHASQCHGWCWQGRDLCIFSKASLS